MKKIYKKLICLSIAILSFVACTKDINLTPISQISNASFWKTENDASGGLTGMYVRMRTQASVNFFLWGEGRSGIFIQNFGMDPSAALYVFMNSLSQTNAGPDWTTMYSVIHDANLLLKYVPGISFTSQDTKNNTLAQAYAMRAFIYFTMAKTWGDLALVTEPTEGYDPNTIYRERSSVADVFKLIKSDIDKALELFPNNNYTTARNFWSKPAVNTLKADVYLWTGKKLNGGNADFTTALNALNDVETSDVTLLPNFSDIFSYTGKGNKEIIMSVYFLLNESPTHTVYGGVTGINAPTAPYTDAETIAKISPFNSKDGYWQISPDICNQFSNDDQRKDATFIVVNQTRNGVTSWMYNCDQKYPGIISGGVRQSYDDYIIYRYADVVLMKAEAKNALGQDPSTEINKIRQRAYGNNYSSHVFVNGTKAENDDAILKERLFELLQEGKRWWDLVRFGKVFEQVPALKIYAGQDYRLLFPISETVLSLEPKMVQNPGY
ncbi:MAG: RagB/SusD family nutrient uptake outer membrane protein [Bacteroidales bacterium]|nr:RagB/SusD family nutrient uptake outer membrane protein [Bacteroidales bacterium]